MAMAEQKGNEEQEYVKSETESVNLNDDCSDDSDNDNSNNSQRKYLSSLSDDEKSGRLRVIKENILKAMTQNAHYLEIASAEIKTKTPASLKDATNKAADKGYLLSFDENGKATWRLSNERMKKEAFEVDNKFQSQLLAPVWGSDYINNIIVSTIGLQKSNQLLRDANVSYRLDLVDGFCGWSNTINDWDISTKYWCQVCVISLVGDDARCCYSCMAFGGPKKYVCWPCLKKLPYYKDIRTWLQNNNNKFIQYTDTLSCKTKENDTDMNGNNSNE